MELPNSLTLPSSESVNAYSTANTDGVRSSSLEKKPVTLRVATRKSPLAVAQAELVMNALRAQHGIQCEVTLITTRGDKRKDRSLAEIGGDGVFSKELMLALLDGRADIAVHSLKDLPTHIAAEVDAGVVPEREDARDILISRDNQYPSVAALPAGASVGTSSLRRAAQLRACRRDLHIADLRGNVDSRVGKVLRGEYDAAVLALAGLKRINLLPAVQGGAPLEYDVMVPAAGQGALYVQCRAQDACTLQIVRPLNHAASAFAIALERSFLQRCGGGCMLPLGVHVDAQAANPPALVQNGYIWSLHACIASADGTRSLRRKSRGSARDAAEGARQVEAIADEMLAAGGRAIIGGKATWA